MDSELSNDLGGRARRKKETLRVDCDWDRGLKLPTLHNGEVSNGHAIRVFRRSRPLANPSKKASNSKSLEDHVRDWVSTRVELGIPESRCSLPFLYGVKKLVECLVFHKFAYPREVVSCSIRGCQRVYHRKCVKDRFGISLKKFKCQQHVESFPFTAGVHQLVLKQRKKEEAYIPKLLISVQILSARLKEIFSRMTQETQL
ncbi:hypothetical protein ACFX13_023394 [Malus domestica]